MPLFLGCSAQGGESGEEQSGDSNFWMEAILSDITIFIFKRQNQGGCNYL